MKFRYFAFYLIIAVGLASGYFLIPKKQELALLYLKSKQYPSARTIYETLLEKGDFSISTVIPLTQVYLRYGDIKSAVELMEQFVAKNPNRLDARRILGVYYKYDQRPDDYLTNLEKLNSIENTSETMNMLSDEYMFTSQNKKRMITLEKLVKQYPENQHAFLELAMLQASQGYLKKADDTLERFERLHPAAVNNDTVELRTSLALGAGRPRNAFERAQSWLAANHDPDLAIRFSQLFELKKKPALALSILESFKNDTDSHPRLLVELIDLMIENGRTKEAFARLYELYEAGKLPSDLYEHFIDIALFEGNLKAGIAASEDIDIITLSAPLQYRLVETAIQQKELRFLKRFLASVGDSSFLSGNPVMAADIYLTLGRLNDAEIWLQKAESQERLSIVQKVAVAGIYSRLGRSEDVLRMLLQLVRNDDMPQHLYLNLAGLYIEQNRAGQGLELFRMLRSRKKSVFADAGWALLETAAGDDKSVISWFDCNSLVKMNEQFFLDLFYTASDVKKYDVTVRASQCLYLRNKTTKNRLRYLRALVYAGNPMKALSYYRLMLPGAPEVESGYITALYIAFSNGDPVSDELHDFLLSRLPDDVLKDKDGMNIFYNLMELKAYDSLLPVLKNLAQREHDPWLYVFAELAAKSNNTTELVLFLKSELDRNDLPENEMEELFYLLSEHTEEFEIIPYIRMFANRFEGNWIYLYEEVLGRYGKVDELRKFLAGQLHKPGYSYDRMTEIIYSLIEIGTYEDVLPFLSDLARSQGEPWFSLYVDVSSSAGEKSELLGFLQAELDRDDLTQAQKQERLYLLLEKDKKMSLPYLRRFAEDIGEGWVFLYEDILKDVGRDDVLLAFWEERAGREDISSEEKRSMAYRMLDAGYKIAAENVFMHLAENTPPDNNDTLSLLFIWGPRPAAYAIDWLETRAKNSSGAQRAGWINHMVYVGAAKRAVLVSREDLPEPGNGGPLIEAYLNALMADGDRLGLGEVIKRELAVEKNAGKIRHYAALAVQNDQPSIAMQAYIRLLDLSGNDAEALRRLGQLEFFAGDYQASQEYLERYFKNNPEGDYESNFYFGEILLRQKKNSMAEDYFRLALFQIKRDADRRASIKWLEAMLLHRTGSTSEAIALLDELLKERSENMSITADMVELLLDAGDYRRAETILSGI